ncbi:HTH-type transcriptional repressor CytR [Streptomyces acidiscabies]|nr:HTH-type transcriptional repressor CytR [Streptomyces acidiscabies]
MSAHSTVSTATVSHALKGTGRMTAHTRDRVRALASALGYDGGSAVPRALGLAVTTYGYTDWNFAEVPFFSWSITAATAAAHRHGYALVTLPCAARQNLWTALRVAGVVLMDSPAGDPVADTLRAHGIPLAFDGRPVDPRPDEVWVDNDHVAATRGVLDHLATQGARRVALLAGPGEEHYTRARRRVHRVVPPSGPAAAGRAEHPLTASRRAPRQGSRLSRAARRGVRDLRLLRPTRPDECRPARPACPRGPARRLRERGSLVRVLRPSGQHALPRSRHIATGRGHGTDRRHRDRGTHLGDGGHRGGVDVVQENGAVTSPYGGRTLTSRAAPSASFSSPFSGS